VFYFGLLLFQFHLNFSRGEGRTLFFNPLYPLSLSFEFAAWFFRLFSFLFLKKNPLGEIPSLSFSDIQAIHSLIHSTNHHSSLCSKCQNKGEAEKKKEKKGKEKEEKRGERKEEKIMVKMDEGRMKR
jgi:hypothetical protein